MIKFLSTSIVVLLLLNIYNNIIAAPFDTGMNELQQPDETTFIGRIWGDEFFYWMETENGYRFVQSGDGWYYYATLDQYGEFAPTIYKVGIDSPPPSSYQLERTQTRIDEINEQIQEFNEQIEINRQWFAQKQAEAQGQPVTLKVAIILIEFKDVKHFDPDEFPRLGGYLKADFDSMMFSYNYWIGNPGNPKHPEEEAIFGSFRDYWHQMSRGKLKIIGKVVNPTDENGVPEWLEADSTRNYYARLNAGTQWNTLAVEAINKAIAEDYISTNPNDTNYYHKYAVIYAREAIHAGALKVHAEGVGSEYKYHFVAERSGPELYGGNFLQKSFTHIGIYAHEFGHTLGFWDEYNGKGELGETFLNNFCLMANGIYNGPDRKGACPATLSPWYRLDKQWLPEPELIDNDETNFLVAYDYDNPNLYKINPAGPPADMYYLFEVRHRQGFDAYIPEPPETFGNQSGTLLIWQHNVTSLLSGCSQVYKDRIRLKSADNVYDEYTQLNDFFPSDGYQNNQNFNGLTAPVASLGNLHDWSYTEPRPAHFALSGIYKDGDNNTVISEIKTNHAMLQSEYNYVWNLVSVPVGLEDYSVSTVFPTAIYVYNSNNQLVSTLTNGPGYWAKFQSELLKNFEGDIIENQEIPVIQGWQIIGTNSYKTRTPFLTTSPPNIIEYIYRYENGGYILMDTCVRIKPGYGYWTKTSNAGTIYMNNISPLNKITSSEDIDLPSMDKFIITDSEEYSQTLYVSNIDIDTIMAGMNLELPPLFPEINFDSRFLYNELVKKVSADSGVIDLSILVHTFSFPVNLTWDINPANGINYSFINDSGTGKILNLSSFGETSFDQLTDNKIYLFATADKNKSNPFLPKEFSLEQNYPNPFNPVTTIKYNLPKVSDVRLIVYDILGREVKTIVNQRQQPGRYEMQFDASGISSGIYFYQLKTKGYVDTKKMILLK